MFYMQENPKGERHPGYRGEGIFFPPGETVLSVQDELDEYDDAAEQELATRISTLAGLLQGDAEMPESVANTLEMISGHHSQMVHILLDQNDKDASRALIRMLSIPSMNSLPPEQFISINDWMEENPDDAWKWAMALENVDIEFPWTEDEFTDNELEQLNEIWNDVMLDKGSFVSKYASSSDEAWMTIHGRLPQIEKLREIEPSALAAISLKNLTQALKSKEMSGLSQDDAAHGAIGLVVTFGPKWQDWLKSMKAQGIGAHDATYWLPHTLSPGLSEFLFDNKNRPIEQLSVVSSAWSDIPRQFIDGGLEQAVSFVGAREFEGATVPELSRLAAAAGIREKQYPRIEKLWLELRKDDDDIPNIKVSSDEFVLRKMDPDDPRDIFLGDITGCCQMPHKAGEAAAWYGHSHPQSAFYVFETHDGIILAQAWVWRTESYIVFDNFEGKGIQSTKYRDTLFEMFQQLADEMITNHGIIEVRVGETYDYENKEIPLPWKIATGPDENARPVTLPPDLMFNPFYTANLGYYSDASTFQHIVSRAENSPEYFVPEQGTVKEVAIGIKNLSDELKDVQDISPEYIQKMMANITESGIPVSIAPTGNINNEGLSEDGEQIVFCEVAFVIGEDVVITYDEQFSGKFIENDKSNMPEWITSLESKNIYSTFDSIVIGSFYGFSDSGSSLLWHGTNDSDQNPLCDMGEMAMPLDIPPIDVGVQPKSARYALLIHGTPLAHPESGKHGDIVLYYKNMKQLKEAAFEYSKIKHLIGRNHDTLFEKVDKNDDSPLPTNAWGNWGNWKPLPETVSYRLMSEEF